VDAHAGHPGQRDQAIEVPLKILGVDRRAQSRAEHRVMILPGRAQGQALRVLASLVFAQG
jgi:hypothetical protein